MADNGPPTFWAVLDMVVKLAFALLVIGAVLYFVAAP